jgi:tetratricopeptide (TPR) repeat protein
MKYRLVPTTILIVILLAATGAAAEPQISANDSVVQTPAGALYAQSVDLANEGKFQEALDVADQALAKNVTSMTGLIQANRAGILVMLHRYHEAITAADAALAVEGNLTTLQSVAWYNKGNALRALGRIAEAQDAYSRAYALDNTLIPPDMSADIPGTPTTPTSPLSVAPVLAAFGLVTGMVFRFRKN